MTDPITPADLEAYLDEVLPASRMVRVEEALRDDPQLAKQLATLLGRLDAGIHSLGGIWRSYRLSCPTRGQLGSFLLEVLDTDQADYVRFHLESIGCRYCESSLEDLRSQHATTDAAEQKTRRQKYYQSSAGYLTDDD